MSGLRVNLIASYLSRGWSSVLALVFVPVYIRFVGVEAYGLIGAFAAVQVVVSLLDLGLGSTLAREFARIDVEAGNAQSMRNLLRTLEGIYWAVALVIAVSIFFLADFIALHWLRPANLSISEIKEALAFAGLAFALQWPTTLYSNGLYGLQQQGVLAVVVSATATLRVAATILALAFIESSIRCFFMAQAFANLIQTLLVAGVLWSRLPRTGERATFEMASLRGMLGFAGGMFGISITAVVLTQLDKAVLSKVLTLEAFGYYAIAGTLATGLYVLISPMFSVFFPRFSKLVAVRRYAEIEPLYHLGNQLMAVIVLPVAAVAALFSNEIIHVWTGSEQIAAQSGLLFSLLILGNALNGLMNIPYAVQLAYGWTSLALYSNIVAMVICVPLIFALAMRLGAVGGAICWVVLTSGYVLISLQIMHSKLTTVGSKWRWYAQDIGGPAGAAFAVAACGRWVDNFPSSILGAGLFLAVVLILAWVAAVLCAPAVRGAILARLASASPALGDES
jgi:O-antigen/teichoic acid export membrane protein